MEVSMMLSKSSCILGILNILRRYILRYNNKKWKIDKGIIIESRNLCFVLTWKYICSLSQERAGWQMKVVKNGRIEDKAWAYILAIDNNRKKNILDGSLHFIYYSHDQ